MLRRGQGRKAATKAKVNDGKRHPRTAVIVIAVLATMMYFPVAEAVGTVSESPSETTEQTQEQEAAEAAKAASLAAATRHYQAAKRHRAKADYWKHRLGRGHERYSHRPMAFTGKVDYESYRRVAWMKKAKRNYQAYVAKKRAERALVNKCVRAGFPRRYCPVLIKAAKAERVPSWAVDSQLAWLIRHESGFRPCVRNGGVIDCRYKGDRAWGLFQFLGSTWSGTGIRRSADPYWQTRAGIRCIKRRYHTPSGATRWWRSYGWY